MSLTVDIEKRFKGFTLRMAFEAGNETLALLGASGCGKSMTLRCVAGVERPDRGRIILDGETLFDSEKRINVSPQERRVGMMFQHYALFPQMTVLQNVRCGARRTLKGARQEKAALDALAAFDLTDFKDRLPHQLSGGQQQRVALARMLVSEPCSMRFLITAPPLVVRQSGATMRLMVLPLPSKVPAYSVRPVHGVVAMMKLAVSRAQALWSVAAMVANSAMSAAEPME